MTQKKRRTGVLHHVYDHPTMTFAMVNPKGQLVAVIDAATIDDAWYIGSGWEDREGIDQRKRQGWKMCPCMIEWEE